jgi:hypothetical protein
MINCLYIQHYIDGMFCETKEVVSNCSTTMPALCPGFEVWPFHLPLHIDSQLLVRNPDYHISRNKIVLACLVSPFRYCYLSRLRCCALWGDVEMHTCYLHGTDKPGRRGRKIHARVHHQFITIEYVQTKDAPVLARQIEPD